MKKIIISLAALAAVSTAALAERNYDISSPPYGETALGVKADREIKVLPFAAGNAKAGSIYDDAAGNSTNSGSNSGAR
jgi:hypothetical protein